MSSGGGIRQSHVGTLQNGHPSTPVSIGGSSDHEVCKAVVGRAQWMEFGAEITVRTFVVKVRSIFFYWRFFHSLFSILNFFFFLLIFFTILKIPYQYYFLLIDWLTVLFRKLSFSDVGWLIDEVLFECFFIYLFVLHFSGESIKKCLCLILHAFAYCYSFFQSKLFEVFFGLVLFLSSVRHYIVMFSYQGETIISVVFFDLVHSYFFFFGQCRRGLSLRVIHLVCDDMRSSTTSPETEVSLLRIDPRETVMTKPDSRGLSWKSFRFVINDIATHGFTLEQVDLSFTKGTKTDSPVFALLGKLNVSGDFSLFLVVLLHRIFMDA